MKLASARGGAMNCPAMLLRLLPALFLCCAAMAAEKPPVVLITVAELGWSDLNSAEIPLPRLTGLLKESAVFRDFHVSPLDAPSRAALLTGLEPARAGVWGNHSGRHRLRGDAETVAALFRSAGYRTGLFGTWALGDTAPSRAADHGYERVLTHGGSLPGCAADALSNDGVDDLWLEEGEMMVKSGTWTAAAFGAAAAFLAESRAGRPFFCHLAPSEPAGVPEDAVAAFRQRDGIPNPVRAAWLSELDAAIGRLLDQLESSGVAEQTVVVLTSTGGTPAGSISKSSGMVLRGHRGSPYEAGHRVPLLIRWPGRVRPGEVTLPAMHYDLLPTVVALTEGNLPARLEPDGISLAPWISVRAEPPAPPERILVVDAQEVPVPVPWRRQCVMSGPWRLINGRELYDISQDPGQRRNLAASRPETVQQLREAAESWWQGLSPDKLEPVRAIVGGVQDPVLLTPRDWLGRGGTAVSRESVIAGTPANSRWMLEIAAAGNYDILLRRWPLTVNRALGDGFFRPDKARLRIGTVDETKAVPPGAPGVNFRVALKEGPVSLQTWLSGEGKSSGAFFVEIRRAIEVRAARPVPQPRR